MKKSNGIKLAMVVGILGVLVMSLAGEPKKALVFGTVITADGAAVAGAEVSAVSVSGAHAFQTMTKGNGSYRLEVVPNLKYHLTVRKSNFVSVMRVLKSVFPGKRIRVDFRLKAGKVAASEITEKEEGKVALDAMPAPSHEAARMDKKFRGRLAGYTTGAVMPPSKQGDWNTEEYAHIDENRFHNALESALSTFSIDVDTASYANVRRFLNLQRTPHKDAVRIEELINYFRYEYPEPRGGHPFSITTELGECPWNHSHQLMMVGIQGQRSLRKKSRGSNLVFLIDVSGSMRGRDKLPLLKRSFKLLADQLTARDRVAIVVYAGAAGLVLPSTPGDRKEQIISALDRLRAGGSTAGGAGIRLAYQVAEREFVKGGNNRIVVATDGDFNVGVSSTSDLVSLIEAKRNKGIFLTVLGFGTGNYKDARLEQLADKGNGNYHYVDSILEGRKVFVHDMMGTLFTIAKDVKIQVEFNPARVKGYRLVGYENRKLANEDFSDDTKDAGELGAGHSVTAFYEIIPASSSEEVAGSGDLKYQDQRISAEARRSHEWATVKFRYKKPDGDRSILMERTVRPSRAKSSRIFQFASAVAEWGLLLRESPFKADASYEAVSRRARANRGKDAHGYKQEFIRLVETTRLLKETASQPEAESRNH